MNFPLSMIVGGGGELDICSTAYITSEWVGNRSYKWGQTGVVASIYVTESGRLNVKFEKTHFLGGG